MYLVTSDLPITICSLYTNVKDKIHCLMDNDCYIQLTNVIYARLNPPNCRTMNPIFR